MCRSSHKAYFCSRKKVNSRNFLHQIQTSWTLWRGEKELKKFLANFTSVMIFPFLLSPSDKQKSDRFSSPFFTLTKKILRKKFFIEKCGTESIFNTLIVTYRKLRLFSNKERRKNHLRWAFSSLSRVFLCFSRVSLWSLHDFVRFFRLF